jgi:Flp pilus assembly protein TadG
MSSERRRKNQRGMAIFFYATMLIFVIGCVGLAVDVGTIYMIRARLVAAVDAAALAAGRSVNLSNTVSEATTNAASTAQQFFAANFPTGYFNSIGSATVTPTFTQETDGNGNPTGVLDIGVTASVSAPTYFMNIFNVHSISVSDTGTASRRGVVLVLVLDESSSMNTAADPVSGLTACQAMVQAAGNFVNLFSPFDYIGVLPFDITAHTTNNGTTGGTPPSQSHTLVSTLISNITCGSNTNTISALNQAYQWIKNANQPLALNSIVLFTDGSPNGITANFPARTVNDSRFGPALNSPDGNNQSNSGVPVPPAQSGSSNPPAPGITNSCDSNKGGQDANGEYNSAICINMPTVCTVSTATLQGTLAQWGDQNSYGAGTYGLAPPVDGAAVSIPASCTDQDVMAGTYVRQFIAYIPNTDIYGNSLHGVAATGAGPTVAGGLVTRDNWIFQVNSLCSPDPTINPNCKNTGGLWSGFANIGMGSNFFPAGSTYAGFFRPDQPNTVVAASMNGTMAQAYTIRSDTTYHPVINVIYLTGNGTDSVDREFLPIVANYPTIPALPYDPVSYTSYTNPAFQADQETGQYYATADRNQLTSLFAKLASEVLRLSK